MDSEEDEYEKHKYDDGNEFSNAGFEIDTWVSIIAGLIGVALIIWLLVWALHI